jgi:type II restriction enzyme
LNRRKSRAGKSLEHHLSEIFNTFAVSFVSQSKTEDNKKPDFLFPSKEAYHNPKFDVNKLILLASKTTCKDRWRQVLNEADRIKVKHLFTLQQGISKNQLEEMYKYNVRLVVPKPYIKTFPKEFRDKIFTLNTFIKQVQTVQLS